MKLIEKLKEWYHEWQQKAREKYLAGYYPGHERMPNFVVRGLYGIGYFFGDFVPLILNFIDAVYATIKRLIAFIVGLLVESSIFIVLIGSIIFSVSHSIERLRQAGATSGLEYIGVLMFEVIFISSAATLTGILMKKKKPSGFIEYMGLGLTVAGFLVGLAFVWWSNVNGMAPTWEGRIIGSVVPLLVLIGEGVLAYRYLSELAEDNQTRLMEIIQRNGLTVEDSLKAIEMYLANRKSDAGQIDETDTDGRTEKESDTNNKTDNEEGTDTITDTDKQNRTDEIGQTDKESDTDNKKNTDTNADTDTESGGQIRTGADSQSDTNIEIAMDADKSRDGHSDTDTDGQLTDTQTDTISDSIKGTDTDGQTNMSDTDRRVGSADTDNISDKDADKQTVSDRQKEKEKSGQTDKDKPARTKSNVVPFEKKNKKANTNADIEKAKQFALNYYLQNKEHISIRKLAEICGIKKYQAEKIRKELEQELAEVGQL